MLINLIKYAVSEGIAKLAPFFTTLYVAKNLSADEFGRYSLIFVVYELCFILITFNIQATTRIDYFKLRRMRFLASKREHVLISLLLAFFLFIISLTFSSEDQYIFVILILSSFVRCISIFHLSIFQCEKKSSSYVTSNLVFTISISIFTIIFVSLGFSYFSWLYSLLLASLIQLLISSALFSYKRTLLFLSFSRINLNSLKSTFIIALFFLPQALGWWLKLGADRWIIERKLGTATLGQYSLAFQFSSILIIAATVMNLVLVPELNSCLKNSNLKRIKYIITPACFLLVILAILIYFVASQVVVSFYNSDYLDSIIYLKLLVFPFLIQSFILIFSNILYYFGSGPFMAKLILLAFSVQIAVNYFYADTFGVNGMILISFFANMFVLSLIVFKSIIELKARLKMLSCI